MEPNNEIGGSGSEELKLKNVAIFGFAFGIGLAFIGIKYNGDGADLFRDQKVTITCLQYLMLVAVCFSTAVKLHQDLLPPWACLALSRASIFCVFQALVMLQSIVLFDKTPRLWFVLCFFVIVFISIPFKQLKDSCCFSSGTWQTVNLAFERVRNSVQQGRPWRSVNRVFDRLRDLMFGRDEHPQ